MTLKEKRTNEDEFDEVVIKDLTTSKPILLTEKLEIKKEIPVTTINPVISKVEPEVSEGPKVVGRLDLDAMNLKTKPDKKTKKEKETGKNDIKPEVEKTTKGKEKKVSEETKQEIPEADSIAEGPTIKEEIKEEFLDTKYEKLEGPKILGRIELPVIKETPKKPVNNNSSATDKKKRKRIRKGGLSQEEIKKVGKEQSAIAREKAKEKYGDPRAKKPTVHTPGKPRHELTEEEIQAQIKETLARLVRQGNKSKTSKIPP